MNSGFAMGRRERDSNLRTFRSTVFKSAPLRSWPFVSVRESRNYSGLWWCSVHVYSLPAVGAGVKIGVMWQVR
jgi:hypothetical protein